MFSDLVHQAAVQMPVSLQGKEGIEVQMCGGEGAAAFPISTGSRWLTVFIALAPVKSPQTRTDSIFQKNLTPSSEKKIYFQTRFWLFKILN